MIKNTLYVIVSFFFAFNLNAQQNPISGQLNHTNHYFYMYPFGSSYNDGSYAKIFYDGNNKLINFWNSDDQRVYTNIKLGTLYAAGSVEGSLTHKKKYFNMYPYDNRYDNETYAKIYYDGNNHIINFGNSSNNVGFTHIKVGNIFSTGKVGIGTSTNIGPHQLAVEGSIGAREIKVQLGQWADFVFESDYNLPNLKEVENYIQKNGHLQNIPSAKEVALNGINLGEMNAKLLQKIEELTLYTIEQEKRITLQEHKIKALSEEKTNLKTLKKELSNILNRLQELESKK